MSDLIWNQIVCKDYQQTALVGKYVKGSIYIILLFAFSDELVFDESQVITDTESD